MQLIPVTPEDTWESARAKLIQNFGRIEQGDRAIPRKKASSPSPSVGRAVLPENLEVTPGAPSTSANVNTVNVRFDRLRVGPHLIEKSWTASEAGTKVTSLGRRRVLPGTVTWVQNDATTTGTGTYFTKDFGVGDTITLRDHATPQNRTVASVTSDTSLEVDIAWANTAPPGVVVATGGTITTDGDYTVHKFTSSGDFVLTSPSSLTAEVFMVGGGGGGAANVGGGGGGGGYYENASDTLAAGTLPVVCGAAGTGAAQGSGASGGDGGASTFNSHSAAGGGGGGYFNTVGRNGGSGGGGGGATGGVAGGTGSAGGNGGASAGNGAQFGGGGGGGAGGNGAAATTKGGNGGAGKATDIEVTGVNVNYGGGGGGAGYSTWGQGTGTDGGGNGGQSSTPTAGANATANKGAGGGGGTGGIAGGYAGGNGSVGVVIIRYLTTQPYTSLGYLRNGRTTNPGFNLLASLTSAGANGLDTPYSNLTGTVQTAASTALVGTGTLFTTELRVGDLVKVANSTVEIRRITAIASNTAATVHSAWTDAESGCTFQKRSWLAVYVITNETGDRVASLLSASFESPVMPAGYSFSRRVGAVRFRDTTAAEEYFWRWNFDSRTGLWSYNEAVASAPLAFLEGTTTVTGITTVEASMVVPPSASSIMLGYYLNDGSAPVYGFIKGRQMSNIAYANGSTFGGNVTTIQGMLTCPVSPQQELMYRTNATTVDITLTCYGWYDAV